MNERKNNEIRMNEAVSPARTRSSLKDFVSVCGCVGVWVCGVWGQSFSNSGHLSHFNYDKINPYEVKEN